MKAAIAMLLLAGLALPGRAAWKDLQPGMDQKAAMQCVGFPLLQNRGRGGAESWTYDRRGYIQFRYGRVSYFEAPTAAAPIAGSSKDQQAKKVVRPTRNAVALGS